MKKTVLFHAVLFLFIFALFGCGSENNKSYISLCTDALSTLSMQTEYHYTSYTLEGNTPDTMSAVSTTEYWISGTDWLSYNATSNYWQMSIDNIQYTALSERNTDVTWQLSNNKLTAPSPVPQLDIDIFFCESVSNVNNTRIIILASDEQSTFQGIKTSDIKAIFTFSENGNLISYEYRFSITNNDNSDPMYYSMLIEYHTFEQGNIDQIIQDKYSSSVK